MKHLRLGTRQSALAQAQARWVSDRLRKATPELSVELVLITTSGDQGRSAVPAADANLVPTHGLQQAPSYRGGLKALFTKEIEDALLEKRIDVGVHSLKDMAAKLPEGLILAAVPRREDPRDAWISKRFSFQGLRLGATIATGAVRRQAQMRHARPDLEFVSIRGNVDTRLRKLEEEKYDGMILALAGLKRLGLQKAASEVLSLETMLPAIGQGALALEAREGDAAVLELIQTIDHPASHAAAQTERAFLKALGGSCQTPIAGYAEVSGKKISLQGLVVGPSGQPYIKGTEAGSIKDAEAIGHFLARQLLSNGADKILS